ncbi:MAG: PAS domain S-box protein [Candidatus Krumholzibacteriota bacterium]|nr:PAS domain S-box protein [Candidatus Krumholzibacteriota bacterium]
METIPASDRSDRNTAASTNKETEQKDLSQIYDLIDHSIMILDPDLTILSVNKATEKLTGSSSDKLIGKKCFRLFHGPEMDSPPKGCPFKKMLSSGTTETMEMEVETLNGVFLVSSTPVFDQDQELKRVIHISADITKRKAAERELRSHKDKYQNLFDNLQEGIWVIDKDAFTSLVNPRMAEMLGYTQDEMAGKHLFDFMDENNIELAKGKLSRRQEGLREQHEFEFIRKDGTRLYALMETSPLADEAGQYSGAVASMMDISERRIAERAIQASEEKYRLIFETAPNLIISVDLEGVIVACNSRAKQVLGYTTEEVLGQPMGMIFHPDYQKKARDSLAEIFSRGFSYGKEYKFVRKDGSLVDVSIDSAALKNEKGEALKTICVISDFTERNRAERALWESEARYRSMMDALEDSVYICSPDFVIEFMNPAMKRRVGYDAVGKKCFSAIYGLEQICDWCIFDMVSPGKNCEYSMINPIDNKNYHVKNAAIPNKDGSISKMTIYRDLTDYMNAIAEKEKSRLRLVQAHKMESIGNLAGGIAHDFNNILTSILGFTELALDEVENGTALEDDLQEIFNAGNRAKELVKQILTFARQGEKEIKPVRVDHIAEESLKFIRSTIPSTVEIRQNIERDLRVVCNATQLHQVFMNLCTNAAQVMEESGGVLEVSVGNKTVESTSALYELEVAPGSYIEIKVSDTGTGIAENNIESIFEPYFTTKQPGEGTGMGLAVVHGIVEECGGQIMVESEPGKGTTFKVLLPATDKTTEAGKYEREKIPAGTERILVVDDTAAVAKVTKKSLERLGYKVSTRISSTDALELFREKPDKFDLVITDQVMPNMSGEKLASELMRIRKDIPVILCTGYGSRYSEKAALKIGIKSVVYKPVITADLARTIRKVLGESPPRSAD